MSVVFVPGGAPSYNILSTDVTAGSTVEGVSYIGALVREIDTGKTYIVMPNMILQEFTYPVASSGGSGSTTVLGSVIVTSITGSMSGTVELRTGGSTVTASNPFPVLIENGSGSEVSIVGTPLSTSENWRVSLISETTGSNSSKTFTVPVSTEYQIMWIWVDLITGSVAGGRQLVVQTQSAGSIVIGNLARAAVTAGSGITRDFLFAPGTTDLLAFRDTDYLTTPIPATSILTAGQKIKIYDNKAIADAQDTMNIQMQIASRSV